MCASLYRSVILLNIMNDSHPVMYVFIVGFVIYNANQIRSVNFMCDFPGTSKAPKFMFSDNNTRLCKIQLVNHLLEKTYIILRIVKLAKGSNLNPIYMIFKML